MPGIDIKVNPNSTILSSSSDVKKQKEDKITQAAQKKLSPEPSNQNMISLEMKSLKYLISLDQLRMRSVKFNAMFSYDFKEGKSKKVVLDGRNYSSKACKAFLEYLMNGKVKLTSENVQQLFNMSDEHLVISLKLICATYLHENKTKRKLHKKADCTDNKLKQISNYKSTNSSDFKNNSNLLKLNKNQTFIDGLKKLSPTLVSKSNNKRSLFTSHKVRLGQIGLVMRKGEEKFYQPGRYWHTNRQSKLMRVVNLETKQTKIIKNGNVTLLRIPKNKVAVISIKDREFQPSIKPIVLTVGRYIFRHPYKIICKPMNVRRWIKRHSFSPKSHDGNSETKYKVNSGWTASAIGFKYIWPAQGFGYVIENFFGDMKVGRGFIEIDRYDKFSGFVYCGEQSQSTNGIVFNTKDKKKLVLTIQLTWKIKNIKVLAKKIQNNRLFKNKREKILDFSEFLKEKAQILVKNKIEELTSNHVLKEKLSLEIKVFTCLKNILGQFGVELLGIRIKNLETKIK